MLIRYFILLSLCLSAASAKVSFKNDIRPILSNHCFRCHGPDENERKANLRLDTFEGATKDNDGIQAIVAGNIDESELIYRISTEDPEEIMPPKKAGEKLTPKQIELLKQWVREGGKYEKHWSYQKPIRPAVPKSQESKDNIKNEIDVFLQEKLTKEGLKPSKEASKETLVRRVSLDLTGLPPSLTEVESFITDQSPKAYENLIDRLLAKPSFGEHWARMWLDLARYADSSGYADDPPRTIWAYRDYVIRSFNENKPFNQFTVEQIAGDLLPEPTTEQLTATAFHRNTQTNNEGGTNDEEYRNVAIVDRVNTTMATWMGTTMACAQCHTHKYDPITQEEYFQLFAILNQTQDADRRDESPIIKVMSPDQNKEIKVLEERIKKLETTLTASNEENLTALNEWESKLNNENERWKLLGNTTASADSGATFELMKDGSFLVSGKEAPTDTYYVQGISPVDKITAIKIEPMTHESLSHWKGPGRKGNFVLNEIELLAGTESSAKKGQFVRIDLPGNGKMIHLAEVEVLTQSGNVATKGKATQSSDYSDAIAARAIDGNKDGDYNKGSVSHTATGKSDPHWEVDLGNEHDISKIIIWNRTDGNVSSRLNGFHLSVLDKNRKTVWTQIYKEAPKEKKEVPLNGASKAIFSLATSSFNQKDFGVNLAIDGNAGGHSGWAIGPHAGKDHHAVFELDRPLSGKDLKFTLRQTYAEHAIGRLRISVTNKSLPARALPMSITGILNKPKDERTEQDTKILLDHFAELNPKAIQLSAELAEGRKKIKDIKPSTTVPVMRELDPKKLRKTHIQLRGNYLSKDKEVTAGLPSTFHKIKNEGKVDRLVLAKWLVDNENPLTARVMANRFWEKLFGIGIVPTSEEFGSQGELPSHPELLDWLAVEFIERGWDMKSLIKLIVMSGAYRQESNVNADSFEKDPDNQLLARGPRFRLSAEMIRDQALAVSGLLSSKMYGNPVRPPQPKLGINAAFGGGIDWKTSEGEDKYRRGIYTTWRRSNPYPSMATFDAPNREVCVVRRDRTNTPLQALVTLNDPVYVEAAQALAREMYNVSAQQKSSGSGIQHGFRICLSRSAKPEEIEGLEKLFNKAYNTYKKDPKLAEMMVTQPMVKNQTGLDNSKLAALTVVGNVLLNLDEFLMKR